MALAFDVCTRRVMLGMPLCASYQALYALLVLFFSCVLYARSRCFIRGDALFCKNGVWQPSVVLIAAALESRGHSAQSEPFVSAVLQGLLEGCHTSDLYTGGCS